VVVDQVEKMIWAVAAVLVECFMHLQYSLALQAH
jgi:hypothetical protein